MVTITRRGALGAAAATLLAAPAVRAQGAFPNKPIRMIVPYPPGGVTDIMGRLAAEAMSRQLGQPIVVENRAGAGGNIGAKAAAAAEPDGYTLLLGTSATQGVNPVLYPDPAFDPRRDLAPVGQVVTGAVLCVVNAGTAARRGWTDYPALVAWARAHPEEVRMGSSGTGTTSHLVIEAVNRATGARITHVPYRGGGPAINDLLAGTIDMMFDVIPALMPHVRAGRFRPLAVGSAERITYVPELREVPGMREVLPNSGIDMQSWYATVLPARVPAPVVARWHEALAQVVRSAEFRERLSPLGFEPIADETPAAFGQYLNSQLAVWERLVRDSGASLE